MRRILYTLFAFGLAVQATPIYRIDFSGIITSGALTASHATEFSNFQTPFRAGAAIHGSIFADLGLAPPPRMDSTGVHWQAPMSARLQLEVPPLPEDVLLPIPDTIVIEKSFGAVLLLQFATNAQVVFPQFTFAEPDPGDRNFRNGGTFGAFLGPGSGIDLSNGSLTPSFAATNLNGTGQFHVLKVDQTLNSQPPLFGLSEFYDVAVDFTVTEARGAFVPEPGTAALAGLAVAGLLIWKRLGARPAQPGRGELPLRRLCLRPERD